MHKREGYKDKYKCIHSICGDRYRKANTGEKAGAEHFHTRTLLIIHNRQSICHNIPMPSAAEALSLYRSLLRYGAFHLLRA